MKLKLAAYTLNEMLIVIIISSIITSLAFTVLNLVNRNMWAIQENLKVNTEFSKLEESLWIDMNRYQNIVFLESKNQMIFNSIIDSLTYKFHSEYIVKGMDTFNVKIENKLFFFNGNETETDRIDAVKLELSKQYRSQQLFVFKRNDAIQFMN
ncbi:hypothetical protein [Psychroserpens damuponensis]|uniref:hypothetical protein n=1 Tax=Psychroserpens damuponensis TaxID=943936 RepID=UPI00058CFABF|nr:hypothetical protein [Psychroserpens damuponensis]